MYESNICVDNIQITVQFHIVSDDTMIHDLVLGRNFLFSPGIQVTFDRGVIIRRIENKIEHLEDDAKFSEDLLLISNDTYFPR